MTFFILLIVGAIAVGVIVFSFDCNNKKYRRLKW